MPRRRPGALRAHHVPVRDWTHQTPIAGLSARTVAAICAVEHAGRPHRPVRPGATADLLRRYRDFLARPGDRLRLVSSECPSCPGCALDDVAEVRDGLETVAAELAPAARAELRGLLNRLDRAFRRRTLPESTPRSTWTGEPLPWWHHRIYQR